jgi:diaminopimelate decarboxylase
MNSLPKLIGFELRDQAWFVENLPLSSITQQFGTPCYVYSHEALCAAFMAYEKACLRADGSRRARVHFAMKSNSNLAILQLFSQLGAGFDLVSVGVVGRDTKFHLLKADELRAYLGEINDAMEIA